MTDTQYVWGWIIYLAGALGCLLSLWLLIRRWPLRAKRSVMLTTAILLLLPGTVLPEQTYLAPALLVSLYDALSLGMEAFWRNGSFVLIAAGITFTVGLLLPVARADKQPPRERQQPD